MAFHVCVVIVMLKIVRACCEDRTAEYTVSKMATPSCFTTRLFKCYMSDQRSDALIYNILMILSARRTTNMIRNQKLLLLIIIIYFVDVLSCTKGSSLKLQVDVQQFICFTYFNHQCQYLCCYFLQR